MNGIFQFIDKLWGLVSENVFVRFEFALPVEDLKNYVQSGRLIFASPYGGFIEWLILSSWCRRQGLGAILVSNRRRILLFSKPLYFLQIIFHQKSFSDLFLLSEPGPRVLFCPTRDRKRSNDLTPVERLLSELYSKTGPIEIQNHHIVPIFIRWRKYVRGESRQPSEYLFGLSSSPNLIGKIWYLIRKRSDSVVTALPEVLMSSKESLDANLSADESEALRIAKTTRRKIIVSVAQDMRVALGPRYHSPVEVKEVLLRDPQILQVIEEVSNEKGVEKRKLMAEAYLNLTEIAADYRYRFIEVMNVLLQWLFTKVFDGLEMSETEIQQIRELMRNKPVVFVSSHRSHLDYLVVPYLLFQQDIVTPHIAAGINLSFWPVGPLLRLGGAFFIRRSFRGDRLYSICLRKYVEYLLKNRFNVKFFIEGTRSRSGKMLPPAYGFLKMVLEAYEKKGIDDIAILPTALCYDEVLEEGSYTKELAGAKKEKESARGFLQSRKIIKKNIGKVYVNFGQPLFTKEIFQTAESLGQDSTLMLQKTAFEISKRINDVTKITPKAIVSAVLLGSGNNPQSLEDILKAALKLARFVQEFGGVTSLSNEIDLRRAIEQTIRRLQKTGIIASTSETPKTFYCHPRFRILLNFYKNNGMHSFADLSMISLAALSLENNVKNEKFIDRVLEIRNILKFEFFFSPTPVFVNKMQELIAKVLKEEPLITRQELLLFSRFLGDILEAYQNVFLYLKGGMGVRFERKVLLAKVLKKAEARQAEGRILFSESLSTQTFSGALSLIENIGVTSKEDKNYFTLVEWTEEMGQTLRFIEELLQIIRP